MMIIFLHKSSGKELIHAAVVLPPRFLTHEYAVLRSSSAVLGVETRQGSEHGRE